MNKILSFLLGITISFNAFALDRFLKMPDPSNFEGPKPYIEFAVQKCKSWVLLVSWVDTMINEKKIDNEREFAEQLSMNLDPEYASEENIEVIMQTARAVFKARELKKDEYNVAEMMQTTYNMCLSELENHMKQLVPPEPTPEDREKEDRKYSI